MNKFLKKKLKFVKQNMRMIIYVSVIAILALICTVSLVQQSISKKQYMGRLLAITPLYEVKADTMAIAKIPYETSGIYVTSEEGSVDDVGAYNGEKQLTEQQKKDKAALEELLASTAAEAAETSTKADAALARNEKYQKNSMVAINENTNVTFTTHANSTGTSTPVYANGSNGTYQGQFVITGYCPCAICCGKTNGITASGKLATANHTIAADKRYAFGTQLVIFGQVYTVEDRGGAITGNHIDVFFNTHAEALQFGKKTNVDVYLYDGSNGTEAADSSTTDTSTTDTSAGESTGSTGGVTLIGDSLSVGAKSAFEGLCSGATVDAEVGRQMSAAFSIVESMKASGSLGDKVIIELGTNGTFSTTDGQSLIDSIGSDRQIYWVNTYGPSLDWYADVNSVISTLAAANSNVTMVDWASVGQAHPEYFASDGIHMSNEGYSAFAQTMYNALY
ncbi:MAG: hypothetical protein K6E10_07990 [Eubacterium sp.]|nr:hypothetical protein [Eubacterium sp.]